MPECDPAPPIPVGHYCALDQTRDGEVPTVSIGDRYTLSPAEMGMCVAYGRERQSKNVSGRVRNMNYSGRDDEDIHISGVIGEYAFCRMFRIPIEVADTTTRSALTEKRFDAVFPNGWKVDIKTCRVGDAPMMVTARKAGNPPTLYAMMVYVNSPARDDKMTDSTPPATVEFRGFASSRTVFDPRNLERRTFRGDVTTVRYVVQQNRLKTYAQIAHESETKGLLF